MKNKLPIITKKVVFSSLFIVISAIIITTLAFVFYLPSHLNEIKEKIDLALADPEIYTHPEPDRFESLSKKRAEAEEAIQKAESLWMQAEEDLEKARTSL